MTAPAAPLTLTATFDPGAGCQLANPPGCNDGNACNGVETCSIATNSCVPGSPPVCGDGNLCTDDSCDPATGCVFTNNTAPCTDGNACTTGDTCGGGACAGAPLVCNDGVACTTDTCSQGTCVAVDNCPAGSTCNAQSGQCQSSPANLVCVIAGKAPPATLGGAMTATAQFAAGSDLDPVLNSLAPTLLFANSTANGGNAGSTDLARYTINVPQTASWFAWGRFYYPGAPASNDANSFTLSIDGGTRRKFGNNKDFFRKFHWDGDGNTETGALDALALGALTAGSHTLLIEKREVTPAGQQPRLDVVCLTSTATPPGDQAVSALLGLGCATAANCDDANACTIDACNAGLCTNSPKDCSDANQCTQDTCNPADGVCGHPAVSCDDQNACTVDTCSAQTGCANAPVACPAGQTCNAATGACQDGAAPALVCRRAGTPNQLLGNMATGTQFTGGADLDANLDSVTTPLLFANSTAMSKNGGSGDEARYTINFPTAGQWYAWGRFYYPGAPGSNAPNSFLVRLDAGARLSFGNNLDQFQKFHWDGNGVTETGAIDALSLGAAITAGAHTVTVEKREVAANTQPRLDVLCISKSATPPTDAQANSALVP